MKTTLDLPDYPNGVGSPSKALPVLKSLLVLPGHQFWPDSISLTDPIVLQIPDRPKQITDCYLLKLATANGGIFATFDRRIRTDSVKSGGDALLVLGAPD